MNAESLPAKLEIISKGINIKTEALLLKSEIENEEINKKDEVDQLFRKFTKGCCDIFAQQKSDFERKQFLIKLRNFNQCMMARVSYSIRYSTTIEEANVLVFEQREVQQAILDIQPHPIDQLIKNKPYWTVKDILAVCEGEYLTKTEYGEMHTDPSYGQDTMGKCVCYSSVFWEYIDDLIKLSIANGDLRAGIDVIIKDEYFSSSEDNRILASAFKRIFANAKENFKGDFPFKIPEYYYENVEIPSDKSEKMLLYKHLRSEFFYKIEAGITKSDMLKMVKKKATQTIKDGVCTYYRYIVDNQEIIVNEYELSCIVSMLIKRDNEKIEKIKQKFSKQKHKS
ncbi:MAG: hypothetical protein K5780_00470 [Alphaproteobacteria bacterium]|nr:hypothetical protein [Alphaproteobacteria bacterium]